MVTGSRKLMHKEEKKTEIAKIKGIRGRASIAAKKKKDTFNVMGERVKGADTR